MGTLEVIPKPYKVRVDMKLKNAIYLCSAYPAGLLFVCTCLFLFLVPRLTNTSMTEDVTHGMQFLGFGLEWYLGNAIV